MKVAVIGGGSTYTPELVNGFLDRVHEFPLKELSLMDIDENRLNIVGGFAQRMVQAKGSPFKVVLTTNQRESVADSRYVITQLRVGQMQARRADEYLGQQYGLIGQETTGVGGMAKALRTIPVIMSIARDMVELAPGALLLNFTNPAGLITEALTRYAPGIQSIGVCNVPITAKMSFIEKLAEHSGIEINPNETLLDTLGLNHLSWHRGLRIGGKDIWPQLLEIYLAEFKSASDPEWDFQTIDTLGMIPNYYLTYYYYTKKKLALQNKWPPSRGEEVIEIEANLMHQYAESERTEPPNDLMKRGGAYYSTLATQLLNAHYNDLGEIHVVNVPHRGAVTGWMDDWVLEMPCRVDAQGIHPIPTEPLPLVCFGLVAQVKSYELLTVEAAVHGDERTAYHALLAHPLGPSADNVQRVLDDLLTTNKNYLPQFWE